MKTDRKRVKIRRKAFEENSEIITSRNRNRLALGFGLILALLFALIFRMGYWQIYKSDELKVLAADMQKVDTEIAPVRGAIYDSRMNTLAETVTEYELYAYTQYIYKDESISADDKAKRILRLAHLTGKDAAEVKELLEGEENLVLLGEGLTRQQVEAAENEFEGDVIVKTRSARSRSLPEGIHSLSQGCCSHAV